MLTQSMQGIKPADGDSSERDLVRLSDHFMFFEVGDQLYTIETRGGKDNSVKTYYIKNVRTQDCTAIDFQDISSGDHKDEGALSCTEGYIKVLEALETSTQQDGVALTDEQKNHFISMLFVNKDDPKAEGEALKQMYQGSNYFIAMSEFWIDLTTDFMGLFQDDQSFNEILKLQTPVVPYFFNLDDCTLRFSQNMYIKEPTDAIETDQAAAPVEAAEEVAPAAEEVAPAAEEVAPAAEEVATDITIAGHLKSLENKASMSNDDIFKEVKGALKGVKIDTFYAKNGQNSTQDQINLTIMKATLALLKDLTPNDDIALQSIKDAATKMSEIMTDDDLENMTLDSFKTKLTQEVYKAYRKPSPLLVTAVAIATILTLGLLKVAVDQLRKKHGNAAEYNASFTLGQIMEIIENFASNAISRVSDAFAPDKKKALPTVLSRDPDPPVYAAILNSTNPSTLVTVKALVAQFNKMPYASHKLTSGLTEEYFDDTVDSSDVLELAKNILEVAERLISDEGTNLSDESKRSLSDLVNENSNLRTVIANNGKRRREVSRYQTLNDAIAKLNTANPQPPQEMESPGVQP